MTLLALGGTSQFVIPFSAGRSEPHYNRRMSFLDDPRRRAIALLAGGVVLLSPAGRVAGVQHSNIGFSIRRRAGRPLVFTALTILVFCCCWFAASAAENILKLYADQSGSALGARLGTRRCWARH